MPKPSAPEDICNLTLDHLKQRPIASITTPGTDTEFIMQRWYDVERMAALRAHPWKFASKRRTLTPNLNTPPPFGYTYAYDLPSDYIRKITIGDDYLGDLHVEHVIENGQILTPSGSSAAFPNTEGNDPNNTSTLYFRYVYDCTEVARFDALFVKYFALLMAIDLAPKFAISTALKTQLERNFGELDCLARAVNGQDAPVKRIQQSKILTKRRGLPGGIFASKYTVFDS